MSKALIGATLARMKRKGETWAELEGRLYSVDELLTMYFGRAVDELQGIEFISHH